MYRDNVDPEVLIRGDSSFPCFTGYYENKGKGKESRKLLLEELLPHQWPNKTNVFLSISREDFVMKKLSSASRQVNVQSGMTLCKVSWLHVFIQG